MLGPTVAATPGGRLLVWINGPAPTVKSGYQPFSAKVARVPAALTCAPLATSAGLTRISYRLFALARRFDFFGRREGYGRAPALRLMRGVCWDFVDIVGLQWAFGSAA